MSHSTDSNSAIVQACRAVLRSRAFLPAIIALVGLNGAALADSLTTTFNGGNDHRGNMFDIEANSDIEISGFEISPRANTNYAIYYREGTWVGNAGSSDGWTLLQTGAINGVALGNPSDFIALDTPLSIDLGTRYSLYITSTNTAVSLNYTDGSQVGAIAAADDFLTIYQGGGLEYPFTNGAGNGGVYQPRIWNGTIYYDLAAGLYWRGQTDGMWTGNNWATDSSGTPAEGQPTIEDDVVFSANGATNQSTTLGEEFEIHSLTVRDQTPVTIGGANTLTITSDGGKGITVKNGANLTISANVEFTGTTGLINVVGTGEMLISGNLSTDEYFQKDGTGMLTLTGTSTIGAGATINGPMTITGANATFTLGEEFGLSVGSAANGSVVVSNGAQLTTRDGDIGVGAIGSVTITGTNSLWSGNFISVGRSSEGNLQILDGGTVSNSRGYVGSSSSGTATVSGTNSLWRNTAGLLIGFGEGGDGTLTVADGGTVESNVIEMGNGGGMGGLNVNGSAAAGRGLIKTAQVLKQGGTATIDFDGGMILPTNHVTDFFSGFASGDITLGAGGLVVDTNSFNIGINVGLDGAGGLIKQGAGTLTLGGNNSFGGDIELNIGTLLISNSTPMGSTGTLKLAGGTTFGATDSTDVYIGNTTALLGDVSLTSVLGSVTFDGEVQLGETTRQITLVQDSIINFEGSVTGSSGLNLIASSSSFQPTVEMSGSASNTYTGLTQVGADVALYIHKDPGAVAINGDLQIDAGGLVIIDHIGTATSMQLSSSSSVTVNGELLFGAFETNISQTIGNLTGSGFITNGNPGEGSFPLALTVNAGTFSGAIREDSGAGAISLTKAGPGTLVLSGTNAYTGGTTIQQGILSVAADNNLGNSTGALTFNGGTLLTTASFATNRSATLNEGGGTIETSAGTELTFQSAIGGGGGLTKIGAGTLILNGNNSYTGNTNVNQGILRLNGTLASESTLVENGAMLTGAGTLLGSLSTSGLTSPGNSPGKLTIGGNFTQTSKGTLRIEIGGTGVGQFDHVAVSGSANLAGALQLVRFEDFQLHPGDRIKFLTADEGVNGTFANVENEFATGTIVSGRVVYSDKDVALVGAQGRFAEVSEIIEEQFPGWIPQLESFGYPSELTPNQMAVARGLDSLVDDVGMNPLIRYLNGRQLLDLPGDFDRIAPEELASIYETTFALSKVQGTNLQRRADDIRSGSNGFSARGLAIQGDVPNYSGNLTPNSSALPPVAEGKETKAVLIPTPDNRWGVFISGTGEWGDVDSDGNGSGYDFRTGGLTFGLDYKVSPNFAVGISAGYANTNADLVDDGRVRVNGGQIGLYATYFTGGYYADFAVSGGYRDYDTKRSALEGTAHGDTDAGQFDLLFGTGYDWKIGALTIGPTATFEYTYLGLDSFDEHGSLAPLHFPDQSGESIRTSLGIKASYDWKVGNVLVKPEIRAAWQHEFGDDDYALDSQFAHAAGNVFTVNGPETGRDSLLLGAGVAIQFNEKVAAYLSYDAQLLRERYEHHAVSGGVRVSF